jgi:hypothetical protein
MVLTARHAAAGGLGQRRRFTAPGGKFARTHDHYPVPASGRHDGTARVETYALDDA